MVRHEKITLTGTFFSPLIDRICQFDVHEDAIKVVLEHPNPTKVNPNHLTYTTYEPHPKSADSDDSSFMNHVIVSENYNFRIFKGGPLRFTKSSLGENVRKPYLIRNIHNFDKIF